MSILPPQLLNCAPLSDGQFPDLQNRERSCTHREGRKSQGEMPFTVSPSPSYNGILEVTNLEREKAYIVL